ncbi:Hypothetical_protein [Hexamita inflata]|uniref:Hypothetical_protein n=1 Tax=Hexamita inflata TaxID=28002 RepID=A0AA86R285_9EUKA|nr:Hypothetical protein HINF_LOCUS51984 [Hexamita inflata]
MKALNNKHPIETKSPSDTMICPKSYKDFRKQIQDYIPESDYNCVSDVFDQLQKLNISLQEALTLPIEELFTMIQGKSKMFSQNINKVFTFYKEISKEFTINVINIYTDLRKCTSTDQLISLLDIKNLMGNLDLQFLKDIKIPIKIDQESQSSKYQEFFRIYQNYLNLYNNVLQIDCKTCQTDHYVGWKVHWDLVLDFVKSHIQHQSFQVLDVLLILGGPKSGKSLTMYLVAVFLLKFVKLIRPQHSKFYFCKDIAKIIQIDCRDISQQQPLQKLQILYLQIAAHIHQTEQQKQQAKRVDIATISSMIQQMFQEAKCCYIITWDDIEYLFQNTDFYSYKLIGNFIKLIMVCDNSPCQHIVAGSSSVALLSILSDIPVNGNSLLRCQHAIVTKFQASDFELSILFDQIFDETNELSKAKITEIIKQVLQQYELSQNCADFERSKAELLPLVAQKRCENAEKFGKIAQKGRDLKNELEPLNPVLKFLMGQLIENCEKIIINIIRQKALCRINEILPIHQQWSECVISIYYNIQQISTPSMILIINTAKYQRYLFTNDQNMNQMIKQESYQNNYILVIQKTTSAVSI